jgi:hypothetical protein
MTRSLLALAVVVIGLCGCGQAQRKRIPQWVIHSRVMFLSEDLRSEREPLPLNAFRLWFPYVAGDLYGPPTTGDFIQPKVNADYTVELDLNSSYEHLQRSLQPTEFTLPYLRIDPPQARIARLTPLALQVDGIEQVGITDWVDPRSKDRLMLVYLDRPARITGSTVTKGRTLRYDVRAASAGYVWIGRVSSADGDIYTTVGKPDHVVLAVTPCVSDSPERERRVHR